MFYSSLCDDLRAARCSEMPSFSADYFWVDIFWRPWVVFQEENL